jgi:hypothetical protein
MKAATVAAWSTALAVSARSRGCATTLAPSWRQRSQTRNRSSVISMGSTSTTSNPWSVAVSRNWRTDGITRSV